jgi:PmbA protein
MARIDHQTILDTLIKGAKAAGADAADALMVESVAASVSYRLGKLEDVERAESQDLGLRVFVGQKVAFISSTDFSKDSLSQLAGRAVAMAKLAPEDKYAGLAPRDRLAKTFPELDIDDRNEPSAETLVEWARASEGAAMAVKGVTNSEGGGASYGRTAIALATSDGFTGGYAGTNSSIGVSVVAGEGSGMERDYDHTSARHVADLESAEAIGKSAGMRSVARLNPRKVKSQSVPVIYDPRVSNGLVGHLAGAISGSSIARGVSFLKDQMGQAVFSTAINIIDDPHRRRGLRSKPFDGEGVANQRWALIDRGVLKTWLLESASARQLGL